MEAKAGNMIFNTGGENERKRILGTNGNVGINITNPNNLLDVAGGDIDVNTRSQTYMIGDTAVLHIRGAVDSIPSSSNLFVVEEAGINTSF